MHRVSVTHTQDTYFLYVLNILFEVVVFITENPAWSPIKLSYLVVPSESKPFERPPLCGYHNLIMKLKAEVERDRES